MTPDQFEQHLHTFGADLGRWPEETRRAARALLAKSTDSREAWKQAGQLDRVLRRDRNRPIEAARLWSITDAALRGIRRQEPAASLWNWLFTKPVGAAFASAAFAGLLAVYLVGPIFDPPRPPGVSAVTFLLSGGGQGANELF